MVCNELCILRQRGVCGGDAAGLCPYEEEKGQHIHAAMVAEVMVSDVQRASYGRCLPTPRLEDYDRRR